MATVTANTDVNEYLPAGATQLDMLLSVEAKDVKASVAASQAVIFGIDMSPSMDARVPGDRLGRTRNEIAQDAATAAIRDLPETAYFAVLAFSEAGWTHTLFDLAPATAANKETAIGKLDHCGFGRGTDIASALAGIRQQAAKAPEGASVTAYVLTDGDDNQPGNSNLRRQMSTPASFKLKARGIGTEYSVAMLREIANSLDGDESFIRGADELQADIAEVVKLAMSKGLTNAKVRMWVPKIVKVRTTQREYPDPKRDMTGEWRDEGGNVFTLPLGTLGEEALDFFVSFEVPPKDVKDPQPKRLAAKVCVSYEEDGQTITTAETEVWARWTKDAALSMKVPAGIVHYRDADGITQDLQDALVDWELGKTAEATAKLGRVRKAAAENGDDAKVAQIDELVEVKADGTVAVRRRSSADEAAAKQALKSISVKQARRKPSAS